MAAAAAIVIVVAGGGWEVYSHILVAPEPAASAAPQQIGGQSGFSTAASRRVPQTLEGPILAVPITEKQKADVRPAGSLSTGSPTGTKKPKGTTKIQP